MKIAVAVAAENALPSSFVVFRGIASSIRAAAQLGYDGVELALKDKNEVNIQKIKYFLKEYHIQVPCISTGQVFAASGLCLTEKDFGVRKKCISVLKGLCETAAEMSAMVNLGRVRGMLPENRGLNCDEAKIAAEAIAEISTYGEKLGVGLVLEPVNRYEINFLNTMDEAVKFIELYLIPNVKLMPDVFHMNIEESDIRDSLKKYGDRIGYVHFADSNRYSPGCGHLDFDSIFKTLHEIQYSGWASVEILPKPEPMAAAQSAIQYLRQFE